MMSVSAKYFAPRFLPAKRSKVVPRGSGFVAIHELASKRFNESDSGLYKL